MSGPKLCECGCGLPAPIQRLTNRKWGHVAGQPSRFRRGHMLHPASRTPEKRFFARVAFEPNSGCWLWTGCWSTQRYGKMAFEGRSETAHRVSHLLFVGDIPDGLHVLHKCDVRCCVNPDHLFLGTAADNMADMYRKGRAAPGEDRASRGEANPHAKLTRRAVREIRAAAAEGVPHVAQARRYDVTPTAIWSVVHRKSWRHVA